MIQNPVCVSTKRLEAVERMAHQDGRQSEVFDTIGSLGHIWKSRTCVEQCGVELCVFTCTGGFYCVLSGETANELN